MNPLNWTGPEFLMLYVPLMVVGYVWARTVARPPKLPDADALAVGQRLDAYEVALLRGVGPFRDAVAASLVHRGVFQLEGEQLVASRPPRTDMTPLERGVVRASGGQPLSRTLLATALETEVARLREKLIQKGLMYSGEEARARRKVPLLVFSALAALGLIKMVLGLLRDRPVGFLFFLLIFGLAFFFPMLRVRRGRTPLGNKVLSALAAEHESLRTTASAEGSLPTLSGAEVALAVALFGTTALATTQMAPMRQYLQTPPPAAATGGSGSVDSSCGCGGSDSSWSSCSDSGWSSSDSSSGSDSSSSSDSGSSDSGGGGGCGGCGGGGGGGD